MSEATHYDAIILGSGQAGNPLAVALSEKGRRTAMIERAAVGGTCVNYGCTPTKTMVASADVAYLAGRSSDYGVRVGGVSVDMVAVRERKREMVKSWREGSEKRLKEAKLVDLIYGEGSFVEGAGAGLKQVRVKLNDGGEKLLTAELVVINTGLSASLPPVKGLESVAYFDNASVMELDVVPEHLIVLGGGYVGLEFGQMFRRFGSRVTVIQDGRQLLGREDLDVADEVMKILGEDGIDVLLETKAEAVASSGKKLVVTVVAKDGRRDVEGTHLLVATGRKPNTERLNLAAAGVAVDEHGFVRVNDRLETNVPGIYAVGDVKGGPAFTHVSYDDYRVLKANLLDGGNRSIAGRPLPYCVFIDPQLGRIGLSELEAREQGRKVRVARLPMSSVARAMETSRTKGFMKALVDPETEEILGATVLGEGGGEIMSMIQIAMMGGLKYTVLRDTVLAHPLLAESLNNLFSNFVNE
jgi:pyruvate/2-oxoglutarate dehydrogenase complex dihydrolipoamide dehydrogenase (E3) component